MRRSTGGGLAALFLCSAVAVNLAGCRQARSPQELPVQGDVITIRDTTNARISPQLEIGVGNFWEESGRGMTAGLFILTRDADGGSPKQEHVRVERGQQLTAAQYQLKVLEVSKGSGRDSFVKLDVVKPR